MDTDRQILHGIVIGSQANYSRTMIDMLRYDIDPDGIRMDVPQSGFNQAMDRAEDFAHILNDPIRSSVIDVEQGEGGVKLLLNTKKVGLLDGRMTRNDRARALTYVATMASAYTDQASQDPDILDLYMSLDRIGNGEQFGMSAALNRWIAPAHEVEAATKRAMGRAAVSLRMESERFVQQRITARVDRAQGISLQTDSFRSSSLDTDGSQYSPDDQILFLHGHNIYDRQTQLVLLSGVIALAKT